MKRAVQDCNPVTVADGDATKRRRHEELSATATSPKSDERNGVFNDGAPVKAAGAEAERVAAELGSLRHLEKQVALLDAAIESATTAVEKDTIAAARVQLVSACTLLRDSLGINQDDDNELAEKLPPQSSIAKADGTEGEPTDNADTTQDKLAVLHFTESIAGKGSTRREACCSIGYYDEELRSTRHCFRSQGAFRRSLGCWRGH